MHYLNSTQRSTFKFCTNDLHNMPMFQVIFRCILVGLQKGRTTFNPNQTGGSTFRTIISRNFFYAHRAFATFFFRVLRNFLCYFRKNRAYCSEVMQRYVIERQLKIWKFSGFVYKTYGKWLFVLKIHFGL